jgi:hypothetical protein
MITKEMSLLVIQLAVISKMFRTTVKSLTKAQNFIKRIKLHSMEKNSKLKVKDLNSKETQLISTVKNTQDLKLRSILQKRQLKM